MGSCAWPLLTDLLLGNNLTVIFETRKEISLGEIVKSTTISVYYDSSHQQPLVAPPYFISPEMIGTQALLDDRFSCCESCSQCRNQHVCRFWFNLQSLKEFKVFWRSSDLPTCHADTTSQQGQWGAMIRGPPK